MKMKKFLLIIFWIVVVVGFFYLYFLGAVKLLGPIPINEESQFFKCIVQIEKPEEITISIPDYKLGLASWYDYDCVIWEVNDVGTDYQEGSGEVECRTNYCSDEKKKKNLCYSQRFYTCASRDIPRGTEIYVENTETGKGIHCRVNDWVENPDVILDLSSHAFEELAPLSTGIIPIKIRINN